MKPLTIAYFTSRLDPKFEWFIYSLNRELKGNWDGIEILLIDYWYQHKQQFRTIELMSKVNKLDNYEKIFSSIRHITPKRSFCQGLHRFTKQEYFAASNARNTAFLYASHDYVVCVDDLSILTRGWIDQVRWAQEGNRVILGSYQKAKNLICDADGSYEYDTFAPGIDSRLKNPLIKDRTAHKVDGSWLFGCSFGLPLELALTVDGFDEACDMQGAEDYDFGIRLNRITSEIYYCPNMETIEDEDLHFVEGNAKFIRGKEVITSNSMLPQFVNMDSDHAMLNSVINEPRILPLLGNQLSSRRLNKIYDYDTSWKSRYGMPCDWRTGIPLKDL